MNSGNQQAWRQLWDRTGRSPAPFAAIDCPQISRRTYRAVYARIRQLLDLSAEGEVKVTVGVDFARVMVTTAQRQNIKLNRTT